jgi:hypothetical protein
VRKDRLLSSEVIVKHWPDGVITIKFGDRDEREATEQERHVWATGYADWERSFE